MKATFRTRQKGRYRLLFATSRFELDFEDLHYRHCVKYCKRTASPLSTSEVLDVAMGHFDEDHLFNVSGNAGFIRCLNTIDRYLSWAYVRLTLDGVTPDT